MIKSELIYPTEDMFNVGFYYLYINGNYFVFTSQSGDTRLKRAFRMNENFNPEFPDSIDLKITNSCGYGCKFCHESSVLGGKNFNLKDTIKVLDTLPKCGIEVAIGGGDVLEVEDDLIKLIEWLCDNKFLPRITINWREAKDLIRSRILTKFLSMNIGVSVGSLKDISEFKSLCDSTDGADTTNIRDTSIFHIIAGVFPKSEIEALLEAGNNILVLGYKSFGRGINYAHDDLDEWGKEFKRVLYKYRLGMFGTDKNSKFYGVPTFGFDNLALEQLNIRESVLEQEWRDTYLGHEFSTSMYIDAVERTFAPTSRDSNRMSWDDISLLDYFNTYKNNV